MNDVTFLGDVHLGKRFHTGVPLHRRGEREKMVWNHFQKSLVEPGAGLHIQVGDLFDTFNVEEKVVLDAAEAYIAAANANPGTSYVLIRGNHDASRDFNKRSSFDVFKAIIGDRPRIKVLTEPTQLFGIGFLPWHPFKSSTELAQDLIKSVGPGVKFSAVVCHCDVDSFGGDDFNLVPTQTLASYTSKIITGHIHKATTFKRDGVEVVVTGSMVPYSHAEDDSGLYYQTLTLEQALAADPASLKNINVRVRLKEGEQLPDLDCLSLIPQKITADAEEKLDIEVDFDEFDMVTLFQNALAANEVGQSVREKIMAKFMEIRNVA